MRHQCIACFWGRARENQTLPPPSKRMTQSEWSGSAHNSSPGRKESLQGTGTAYTQAKDRKGEPGQGEWPVLGSGLGTERDLPHRVSTGITPLLLAAYFQDQPPHDAS